MNSIGKPVIGIQAKSMAIWILPTASATHVRLTLLEHWTGLLCGEGRAHLNGYAVSPEFTRRYEMEAACCSLVP